MGPITDYLPSHPPAARASYPQRYCADANAVAGPPEAAAPAGARLYRVRKLCIDGEFSSVTQALAQWSADKQGAGAPLAAIIEIADSGAYHEAPHIRLDQGEHLQVRAAGTARPVLRMFEVGGAQRQQIRISGAPGSTLVLDGLLVAGGAIDIDDDGAGAARERFLVTLRHCTLVPGWETDAAGASPWRGKASVQLRAAGVVFRVNHSVIGPIQVVCAGPVLYVGDSIVDAGHPAGLAISDDGYGSAPARASFVRTTLIGLVQVEQVALAENSVFLGPLLATQRNTGSVRRCYVAQGSRTPQREDCLPRAVRDEARVRPRYLSLRYGTPGYGQLAPECAADIRYGADHDAAMGALHDAARYPAARSMQA